MIDDYRLVGHAIVSADDKIADATGEKPETLDHPGDWARFQDSLDRAALVVLGRRSHESTPNDRGRTRLVMSRQVTGLTKRADGWWWNPADVGLKEALHEAAPGGGSVAIPGGREVFDYFLQAGYDAFHLSRVEGLMLEGGVPVFSACEDGTTAEAVLDAAGLRPRDHEVFDKSVGVSVTVWRKL